MLYLYTLCYRQGVARPKEASSLVRERVNATHPYVPTLSAIKTCLSFGIVATYEPKPTTLDL